MEPTNQIVTKPMMPTLSENYDLVDNVRKWVAIDTQMRKVNDKMREYRDVKAKLSRSICEYIETHEMKQSKIDISDGTIRFYEKREYSPLTFSYIDECLHKIIPNEKHIEYIIQYLKDHREVKISNDIKRGYK